MSAKQSPQLILEAQLAMVLFLPGNVALDLLQVGLANRKVRLPALPLEIPVVRSLLTQPQVGHPLQFFHPFGLCDGAPEAAEQVDVVFYASHQNSGQSRFFEMLPR